MASILASCELRYWPLALAVAGSVFGPMRRQDDVITPHAVLERLLTEVGAPGPHGDDHLDRAGERVDAELAVAAVGQRPHVTGLHAVGRDHLVRGLAELLGAVGRAA